MATLAYEFLLAKYLVIFSSIILKIDNLQKSYENYSKSNIQRDMATLQFSRHIDIFQFLGRA